MAHALRTERMKSCPGAAESRKQHGVREAHGLSEAFATALLAATRFPLRQSWCTAGA